jgi:hypothetical protein
LHWRNGKKKEVSSVSEGGQQCLVAATDVPLAYSSIKTPPLNYTFNSGTGSIGSIYVANCSHGLPIVFDTGCSISVSPFREDFIGERSKPPTDSLQGLKGKVKIVGVGRVNWTVFDVYGVTRTIKMRAVFDVYGVTSTIKMRAFNVPEGNIWLFSPQMYFQENDKGAGEITSTGNQTYNAGWD